MLNASSQLFFRELDKLLLNIDATVYKHAVLGLISRTYVSDAFAERLAEIEAILLAPDSDFYVNPTDYISAAQYEEAIQQELEEDDCYIEKNVFWISVLGGVRFAKRCRAAFSRLGILSTQSLLSHGIPI